MVDIYNVSNTGVERSFYAMNHIYAVDSVNDWPLNVWTHYSW